jgi:hypothetical protein
MAFRSAGYDRKVPATDGPRTGTNANVDRIIGQPQAASLPELRQSSAAQLPTADDVRKRDLLGVPIAMTDYEEAMDVMDGMVSRREKGYICAVAVHALTVAHTDPEMKEALLGSTLVVPDGMPLVWAANMLGEDLRGRVYGPELMRRYSQRCARPPRLALRRPRPGAPRPACAPAAPAAPRHQDRRRLRAAFPSSHAGGRGRTRRAGQPGEAGRALGRHRRAEAGEVDAPDPRAA